MRSVLTVLAVAFALATAGVSLTFAPAASADTGPIGLPAMDATGWSDLPFLDADTLSGNSTSFDRYDSNDDGFTGSSYLGTESNGDKTIAELDGPGEITHIFFAGNWPSDSQIKIYLDGSTTASVDESFANFFAGTNGPYNSPLVVPQIDSAGAFSSYLPIPYATSIKIDVTLSSSNPYGTGGVYGVDYQRYPVGTAVTTFDPSQTSSPEQTTVQDIWDSVGSDPTSPTDNYSPVSGTVASLPSNGAATIFNESGPAEITAIKLTGLGLPGSASDAYAEDILNNIWIRIYWDGESTPSVDAPIGSFFGLGLYGADNHGGSTSIKALPVGYDATNGDLYMYFPMPFQTSAEIQLYNSRGRATPTIGYTVLYRPFTGSFSNVGYFHTQFRFSRERATDPFDYVALSANGSGKFVGLETSGAGEDSVTGYNDQAIHWMEGDEHVYIDGSQTPQWDGTGTEDYFGGAGYFCCGDGDNDYPASEGGFSYFSNPLNGFTAHEFPTSSYAPSMTGNMAMYRVQPNDGINFRNSIVVSFEHGGGIRAPATSCIPPDGPPPCNDVPLNSDFLNQNAEEWTLAYYYYKPDDTSVLTDTFTVGDPSSQTSHDYTVSGGSTVTNATYAYEGDLDAIDSTMSGQAFSGYSQFNLAINSSNDGVILRRTFDQGGSQPLSADVYVNGSLVGPWDYAGTNANFRWRDDDMEIPASYTSGLSSITVKIVNLGTTDWNAYRYEAFSIVSPTSATQPALVDGATYQVSSLVSHLDLDVTSGGSSNGTPLLQDVSVASADGQLWQAIALPGNNIYAFVNVNSGRVLGGSAGAQAQIQTWTGSPSQMWSITNAPTSGYYIVKNVGNSGGTSEVLDVDDASQTPGTAVQQYAEDDTSAQQWRFEKQDVPPTLFPVTTGVPDTPARIQSGAVYSLTAKISGLPLDLRYGAPASAGGLAQQYTANGSCAQQWRITSAGGYSYTIATTCATSPSGETLVLQAGATGNELTIQQISGSDGSADQQWIPELVKDGDTDSYYRLLNVGTGNVFDVCDSGGTGCDGTSPGDNVDSYTWNATRTQLWRLQIVETNTCSNLPDGCGRWYELNPLSSSSVRLDQDNASTDSGSGVQVYNTNHTCSQEWRADYVTGGYYKLVNLCSDKVLGVDDASTSAGADLQQWTWNGTNAELWYIAPASTTGYVTLKNKQSGYYLDAGASTSGTPATQQTYSSSSTSQQWLMQLEP